MKSYASAVIYVVSAAIHLWKMYFRLFSKPIKLVADSMRPMACLFNSAHAQVQQLTSHDGSTQNKK